MKFNMKLVSKIATWLVIIGGINCGLAVFDFNLVNTLVGRWEWLETTIYGLVGISALLAIPRAIKK